jgi:hypothetical protein
VFRRMECDNGSLFNAKITLWARAISMAHEIRPEGHRNWPLPTPLDPMNTHIVLLLLICPSFQIAALIEVQMGVYRPARYPPDGHPVRTQPSHTQLRTTSNPNTRVPSTLSYLLSGYKHPKKGEEDPTSRT